MVDAEALGNVGRRAVPRSAFRVPTFYVHRAPLPLCVFFSRRRFPPRAAGARRVAARLPRARPHRPPRLYGSMAFAQGSQKLGLQAITGAELTLLDGAHVTLLAETPEGY